MGFFFNGTRAQAKKQSSSSSKHIPIKLMNDVGCKVCPLDKATDLTTPKMEADGSSRPSIYILGEAPGETEDSKGIPFVGKSGKLLRGQFSTSFIDREVRIHNTIRCRPPENRTPEMQEIECCRGFIERDIESAKPLVIVGAGGIPLSWATQLPGGVNKWRGKLVAVKIGNHSCWYFPILHPSYVLRKGGKYNKKSEVELVFEHDLDFIISAVETDTLPPPPQIHEKDFDKGIISINGESSSHLNLLEDLLNNIAQEDYVGIDLETSGLRPYHDNSKIYTCAVGTFDNVVAFALDHPQDGWSDSMRRKVHGLFADFLLQSNRKIAHHLAFEMEWISYFYGKEILRLTEWEDTLAQAHTIDERTGTNKLDYLTRQYFGFFLKEKSRVDATRILDYPLDEVLPYNGMDSKWTHKLFCAQKQFIDPIKEYVVEYERKISLIPTLVLSQHKGVIVDLDYAEKMDGILKDEISDIEYKIYKCPEVIKYNKRFSRFRPTAPEDVLKLLKDICNRDEVEREDGSFTSGEEVLSKIPSSEVPSASLILEHRTSAKLLSVYVEPIISKRIVYSDGRVHTKYDPMVAVTGRLASEDPNLQNFPKRKHKDIRGILVPPPGYWLLPCDYGQIEARVIAMASEDKNLVKYLWTGYDIHGYWGKRFLEEYPPIKDWLIDDLKINGDDDKAIHKAIRQEAKNKWVFPQFFGSHFTSCARDMHVPDDVAKSLMDEFWDEFSGVKKWQEKLIKMYEKKLYVETLSGRRRRGIMTKNELINHPIQGSACDIVTKAMDALSELSLELDDDTLQPPLNVHDDLTFYIPDNQMEEKMSIIATEMCRHRFDYIIVPLIVEVSAGVRWHEISELGIYSSEKIFNLRNPFK